MSGTELISLPRVSNKSSISSRRLRFFIEHVVYDRIDMVLRVVSIFVFICEAHLITNMRWSHWHARGSKSRRRLERCEPGVIRLLWAECVRLPEKVWRVSTHALHLTSWILPITLRIKLRQLMVLVSLHHIRRSLRILLRVHFRLKTMVIPVLRRWLMPHLTVRILLLILRSRRNKLLMMLLLFAYRLFYALSETALFERFWLNYKTKVGSVRDHNDFFVGLFLSFHELQNIGKA